MSLYTKQQHTYRHRQQILQLLKWGGSIGLLDYSIILQTTMENKQQGFTL